MVIFDPPTATSEALVLLEELEMTIDDVMKRIRERYTVAKQENDAAKAETCLFGFHIESEVCEPAHVNVSRVDPLEGDAPSVDAHFATDIRTERETMELLVELGRAIQERPGARDSEKDDQDLA